MTHRLRFLPLALILGGVALALIIEPSGSSAAAAEAQSSRPDSRIERRATAALRIARRARTIARRAVAQATTAIATADAANARLDSAEIASDTDAGAVSTAETTDYADLGGPAVSVDVPASGLIEVWATVRFDDPSDGAVALYEDGRRVPIPGQEGLCSNGSPLGDVLLSFSGGAGQALTLSTPAASVLGFGCGTPGTAPAPVLFERTPGPHTYELRYADCGCEGGSASFSARTLRVAGRE